MSKIYSTTIECINKRILAESKCIEKTHKAQPHIENIANLSRQVQVLNYIKKRL